MKRALIAVAVLAALLLPGLSQAQTTYDSINVKVNSGDPTSATFTFASNLIQVQFRCVNGGNPTWFYYTRPNTSVNFTEQGHFEMQSPTACQYSYSTEFMPNDILTVVVNAPLTGQASNGQTVTVVFANFTSDHDRFYDTAGGNARITVGGGSAMTKPFYPCGSKHLPCDLKGK